MKKITRIEPAETTRKPEKLRVAAYCRVSTGMGDQLVSLEAQKAHYEETIAANPDWEFAGLYYDEGITGTKKEKRPALLQMIADCEEGKIGYVLTKSLSRFARNTTDCLEIVRKLQGLGISIFFEKENIDTRSMDSELLLSIMSSLAESESVSISENNKWGVRHRFETGTFKIGYAPFGYTVEDGEFLINEEEARWVRYIFEQTLAGKSSSRIAEDLNEKGVPARKAEHWNPSSVRGILRNEKYVGDCLFQKTYSDFRFQRHTNRGERDQFYMEDHHEPIISREDFEAADQILRQHAKEKNVTGGDKYVKRYPFTKKIICGECGTAFKRRINSTGKIKYPAWVCRKHLEKKEECSMRFVREDALEHAFAVMMNKLIFGKTTVLENLLENLQSQSDKETLLRIDEINTALEGMTERRQTLTSIMTKGYIDPAVFTQETNNLIAEAAALEEEREKLMGEVSGDRKKTEALRELIRFAGKGEMLSGFDPALFEQFVEQVTVCSREDIEFHLKCGLNVKERIG